MSRSPITPYLILGLLLAPAASSATSPDKGPREESRPLPASLPHPLHDELLRYQFMLNTETGMIADEKFLRAHGLDAPIAAKDITADWLRTRGIADVAAAKEKFGDSAGFFRHLREKYGANGEKLDGPLKNAFKKIAGIEDWKGAYGEAREGDERWATHSVNDLMEKELPSEIVLAAGGLYTFTPGEKTPPSDTLSRGGFDRVKGKPADQIADPGHTAAGRKPDALGDRTMEKLLGFEKGSSLLGPRGKGSDHQGFPADTKNPPDPIKNRAFDARFVSEMVRRAYRALLLREPEAGVAERASRTFRERGMAGWKAFLSGIAGSAEFKKNIRPKVSDEELLSSIYENLLGPGRRVDAEGRRAYLPLIARGRIARAVEAVGSSQEFVAALDDALSTVPQPGPGTPEPIPTPKPKPPAATSPPGRPLAEHIKYFGYFRDEGLLGEIADHANLTMGLPGSDESGSPSIPVLREAKRRGMKVMLDLGGVIGFRPEEEGRRKWAAYAKNVGPYIDRETVAAFYMYDEPPLEMTPELLRKLETGARMVRETYPGIPIALGLGWWSLSPDLQGEWPLTLPQGYDWFAFNCYGPFENCVPNRPTPVRELFNLLKSKLKPGQRIFLIPEGTDYWAIYNKQAFDPKELIPRADQYLELAVNEPVVIGYVPFLYAGYPPGITKVIRDLPELRDKFREIGRKITGRR